MERINDFCCTGYTHTARTRIMAWVNYLGNNIHAEITDADATSQTAEIYVPGYLYKFTVKFSQIHSVALYQGETVLEAFGRPRATVAPAWAQYAQVQP